MKPHSRQCRHILHGRYAAGGNEINRKSGGQLPVQLQIGALHGAVPGNVGADDGFHAQYLHLFKEIHGFYLRGLRPAFDGDKAVFQVHTHGNFLAVGPKGCLQKIRVPDRGSAQNDPADPDGKVAFHGFHIPDAAAHLRKQAGSFDNIRDNRQVRGLADSGALQVHKMNTAGPCGGKIPGNAHRVVAVNRHLGILSLKKPHGFAAIQVNGRIYVHRLPS